MAFKFLKKSKKNKSSTAVTTTKGGNSDLKKKQQKQTQKPKSNGKRKVVAGQQSQGRVGKDGVNHSATATATATAEASTSITTANAPASPALVNLNDVTVVSSHTDGGVQEESDLGLEVVLGHIGQLQVEVPTNDPVDPDLVTPVAAAGSYAFGAKKAAALVNTGATAAMTPDSDQSPDQYEYEQQQQHRRDAERDREDFDDDGYDDEYDDYDDDYDDEYGYDDYNGMEDALSPQARDDLTHGRALGSTVNTTSPPSAGTANSQTPFDERADKMRAAAGVSPPELKAEAYGDVLTPTIRNSEERVDTDAVSVNINVNTYTHSKAIDRASPEQVSKRLLDAFACQTDSTCGGDDGFVAQRVLPILPQACIPEHFQQQIYDNDVLEDVEPDDDARIFSNQFAGKFLDELLNVGTPLIYHHQQEEADASWVGRSVTLVLRPGVVTALHVEQPCFEWTSMGAGRSGEILTKSVNLMDIHTATSATENPESEEAFSDGNGIDGDEPLCFSTVTAKDGDVHLFESITPEQSERLVHGIKNLTARYARLIAAGDPQVLSDFYNNNTVESAGSKLTPELALLRVCHAFMDH